MPFKKVKGLPKLLDIPSEDWPEGRFYTLPSGALAPSVTTVLGYFERPGLEKWRTSVGERESNWVGHIARDRGNHFHNSIDVFLDNKEPPKVMPHVRGVFNKIKYVLTENVNSIYYKEQTVYSDQLGLAGRVDLVAKYQDVLSIIDFKTARRPKSIGEISHYFEQMSAYYFMVTKLANVRAKQLVCIIANDEQKECQVFVVSVNDAHSYYKGLIAKNRKYKELEYEKIATRLLIDNRFLGRSVLGR